VYVNSSGTAAGWGLTWGTGYGKLSREVDLTIVPMKEGQSSTWLLEYHEKMNISKDVNLINETHAFCAGRHRYTSGSYNYTGIQAGDSGSPLILNDKKTGLNTLIGVATLAPLDTEYEGGPYFVYSDVKKFLPWIMDIIKV
jgi:hypothetical protein